MLLKTIGHFLTLVALASAATRKHKHHKRPATTRHTTLQTRSAPSLSSPLIVVKSVLPSLVVQPSGAATGTIVSTGTPPPQVAAKREPASSSKDKAKKPKAPVVVSSSQPYLAKAQQAIAKLQTFYNTPRPGQWSEGWWNSANCYTLLADLRSRTDVAWLRKITDGNDGVFVHSVSTQGKTPLGGLNWDKFFDDDQWWVLGLIKAYDVTGNASLLTIARGTWQTVQVHALGPPCGGLYNAGPGIPSRSQSTITTLLYVETTSLLAARYPAESAYFIGLSENMWDWVYGNIFQYNYIRGDGQKQVTGTNTCVNNGAILSYIEGTAINALVALNAATGNETYLALASIVAARSLADPGLNQNGVLHDTCDVGFQCNQDEAQFKGVLMRGLRNLYDVMPSAANGQIPAFLQTNANAIWNNARASDNSLGQNWSGPFNDESADEGVALSQHSSATMALVAAAFL